MRHASLHVYGEMVGVTEGVAEAVAVDDAPLLPLMLMLAELEGVLLALFDSDTLLVGERDAVRVDVAVRDTEIVGVSDGLADDVPVWLGVTETDDVADGVAVVDAPMLPVSLAVGVMDGVTELDGVAVMVVDDDSDADREDVGVRVGDTVDVLLSEGDDVAD